MVYVPGGKSVSKAVGVPSSVDLVWLMRVISSVGNLLQPKLYRQFIFRKYQVASAMLQLYEIKSHPEDVTLVAKLDFSKNFVYNQLS